MRRAPCAGSTRLSSLASTSTREPGWMSVQCACQVCVVSARVWRGCREGGHARATSIASSVAAGERAGCTMHHEPRGSCALTLQNGRVRQLPKLPFYYSAFLCGNCGICGKCGKQFVGRGRYNPASFFLGLKIPRPSVSRVLPSSYVSICLKVSKST